MKNLETLFGSKEMLTKDQMMKISGGTGTTTCIWYWASPPTCVGGTSQTYCQMTVTQCQAGADNNCNNNDCCNDVDCSFGVD